MKTLSFLRFAVALALFLPGMFAHAAGLPGTVEAEAMRGFGRIIINFKEREILPEYTSELQNGILQIRFEEAILFDPSLVSNRLGQFVAVARPAFGEQGMTLALVEGMRVNVMDAGEQLYVDLIPPTWQGEPPGLPPEVIAKLANQAKQAIREARELRRELKQVEELPELRIRFGSHPTFTRMVFDWSLPFDTTLAREGDLISLAFNRKARLDIGLVRARMPELIRSIEQVSDDTGLSLYIRLAAGIETRSFREEGAFVLDLTPTQGALQEQKQTLGATDNAEEAPAFNTVPADNKAMRENKIPFNPAAPPLLPTPALSEQGQAESSPRAETPPPETYGNPEFSSVFAHESTELPPIDVKLDTEGGLHKLTITSGEAIPAAIFQRQRSLWVVLETSRDLSLPAPTAGAPYVFQRHQEGKMQALVFQMDAPFLFSTANSGHTLLVNFGNMLLDPPPPLVISRKTLVDGRPALNIDLGATGGIFRFRDPVVGDDIWGVTSLAKTGALMRENRLVELQTLISARGFAFLPLIDNLDLRLEDGQVLITSKNGLVFSQDIERRLELKEEAPRKQVSDHPLALAELWQEKALDFRRKKINYDTKLAQKIPSQRKVELMDYARFFLANDMAAEGLGTLNILIEENPELANNSHVQLLYGVANTLMWRPGAALKNLATEALAENPDARFWRMLAHARLRQWPQVRELSTGIEATLKTLPPRLRNEALLMMAEAHLYTGAPHLVETLFNALDHGTMPPFQQAHYNRLMGAMYESRKDITSALQAYATAEALGHSYHGARASFEAIRLKYINNQITRDETVEALEGLALAWRGDDVEMDTFLLLARLYAGSGRYREAFNVMKTAVVVNPDAEETRLLQDEMKVVLAGLFKNPEGNESNVVARLALFYDYRELIPVGWQGDAMVRDLAHQLVRHELVEEATRILSHQIDNRLSGAARSQIAGDLAVVQLRARRPLDALNTLRRTEHSQMPETLMRQRRLLETRALNDIGRYDAALDLIAGLVGDDVNQMRADIYWHAERWKQAGEALEEIYASRWENTGGLSDEERDDLLRCAVSFVLADDEAGLMRARALFLPLMSKTSMAATFDVVTRPKLQRDAAFADVMRNAAALDTLNRFLDEYNRRYRSSEPDTRT